ncbi:efflux transporter outer membrane subunit [Siccirubricoccus sp. KC 17139]|uniref:Efflux transporter outer membrane subunit n=1 Tax=Siccirubricoccus soli TaxID=2899147 RepID=A0ABT1D7F7_9PROT|nr:efflux transporter outer membrane subunit [Siccirubricoccus soli]MCO6417858.1 efflux transporter outer membrane subunit [Siccirubricoccus soli]MCP2683993.1 efflux transporter outer membrane subunit [Siccirubricoccus soli]
MASSRRAALLLALPLAGCGWLTPGPTSSGLTLPARMAGAEGAAEPAWPDPEWWRGFGAPELDRLMAEAMQANNDMAAAAARILQADAQLRIAGAALLPTVDFAGQATRSQSGSVNTASVTGARTARVRVTSSDRIALSASYEIDFWGKNRAATEAAQLAATSARFAWATLMLTTQASVANTYFALLAFTEQLKLQRQNLEIAERVRQVIADRVTVGTGTGLDLAQQETVVAQQRAAIPPLVQQLEQNRNALGTLIGRPPEGIALAADVFTRVAVPRVMPGLPAEVLARRPDVLSAESDLAAAQASVVAARAALLPSVTLTGSGGYTSLALETLTRPSSLIFTLAAGIAQPIFEGGRLRGQVQFNEARAQELLATYRGAILAALVDTENALVGLRQATEQEALQAEAVRMAERAYAISEAQLRAGTIDLITLLNTQQTLFSARNTLTSARLARLQAAVGLFRALGGGWGNT